jgi:hypothetical protein
MYFLHNCANAIWSLKGTEGFHLSTLVTFLRKKVSITLQRMQTSSILSRVIAVGLTTSRLPPLQYTLPITMADLLQAVNFWHVNMANLPQAVNYGHAWIFTPTLSQFDILSLLLFLYFTLVYISLIYDVFLNKNKQVFNNNNIWDSMLMMKYIPDEIYHPFVGRHKLSVYLYFLLNMLC